MAIGEEQAQWNAIESQPRQQTDEPAPMSPRHAVGQFDAAVNFPEDMFMPPIGERTFHLYISERIGPGAGFMARNPSDGKRTKP